MKCPDYRNDLRRNSRVSGIEEKWTQSLVSREEILRGLFCEHLQRSAYRRMQTAYVPYVRLCTFQLSPFIQSQAF